MHETDGDLADLQRILDASADASGGHLRAAFGQEHRPSAADVAAALQGIFEMHLAVVTAGGAPLVAPIDGIFYRGRVWVGMPTASVRARLVRRRPDVSASRAEGAVAFIVHGRFHEPPTDDPSVEGYSALARSLYVEQLGDWFGPWLDERNRTEGPGVTGWIEPRRFYAKIAA